jgi:hypothetical protein
MNQNDKQQQIIDHLMKGLQEIVKLKDQTQYRDPFSQAFAGALEADGITIGKDGWVDMPKPMQKAFQKASNMAKNILDTMPKNDV